MEPPLEETFKRSEEYANGRLDDMSIDEVIEEAWELGILERGPIYDKIKDALFQHFIDEWESE